MRGELEAVSVGRAGGARVGGPGQMSGVKSWGVGDSRGVLEVDVRGLGVRGVRGLQK